MVVRSLCKGSRILSQKIFLWENCNTLIFSIDIALIPHGPGLQSSLALCNMKKCKKPFKVFNIL